MKVIENKTLYRCDFCKKKLLVRQAMERHEKYCTKNPNNFSACNGCAFIKETKTRIREFYGEEEIIREAKGFFCSKLNKKLYPKIVERKGLLKKYPETFSDQEPMPKECEYFRYEGQSDEADFFESLKTID